MHFPVAHTFLLPFLFGTSCSLLLHSLANATSVPCPPVQECLALYPSPCPLLPVPKASLEAPVSAKGYNVTTIRPGVFRFTDGSYATLILFKNSRLAVVDFPDTDSSFRDGAYLLTHATLDILHGTRPKRVDMIYSHSHTDHIGSAGLYHDFISNRFPGIKISVWGTRETRDFIRTAKNSTIPIPKVIVPKSARKVRLADTLLLDLQVSSGHTQSDIITYIHPSSEGAGVVHLVDFLRPGFAPFIDFGIAINLGAYLETQERVVNLDFNVFSSGHGRIGRKKDVEINIEYTKDVIRAALEAPKDVTDAQRAEAGLGKVADPTAVEFGNVQWLFKTVIELEGNACLRRLIGKWGCALGAVDVFGMSHCKEALAFNLVES